MVAREERAVRDAAASRERRARRPDVLLEHVEQFAADIEDRLDRYRALERTNSNTGHDWYHRLLLDYAIDRAERELDWAGEVARKLRRR